MDLELGRSSSKKTGSYHCPWETVMPWLREDMTVPGSIVVATEVKGREYNGDKCKRDKSE